MNIQHILALKKALDHLQANRPAQTLAIAGRVLEVDPDNADAWYLSGAASHEAGQSLQALQHLNQACRLVPDSWEYLNFRALVLQHLGRFEESCADYEQSLHHQPDHPETLANLARVHMLTHRPDLAQPLFRQALAHEPDNASLHGDLGVCLMALKAPEEAIASYRSGLAIDPHNAEIHYNLSRALLMLGEYEEGWTENEWRWRTRHYRQTQKTFPLPVWQGEPLHGRRIVLIQEQGFGDTIQMIRYAQELTRQGARTLVTCDQALLRLFAAIPAIEHAVTIDDPMPEADYCCPMLSLPRIFKTRLDSIPQKVPYLFPPDHLSLQGWPPIDKHPAIGLAWRGKSRSQLQAQDFQPLFAIRCIRWVSLQKETLPGELDPLPILNPQTILTDFAATAAIMSQLDLVVSIETATAHLAGALGKPVWIMIPYASEWRWLAAGTHAPWYPSARLYRQTTPSSWTQTIAQLANDLTLWAEHFLKNIPPNQAN
ncbi:MAG: tetratricopeptide repeat protein [Magnetococcales bacterium]|nr:tetratricopeptide repeat protein [Magnetococcales bacterium]